MASEIRVNKIENRSGLGTVTFADTGVDLAGIVTATTFSGSGASLTALPSAQLSGALPAISAASLTNVPAANVVGVHTSLTVTNATTTGTAVVGGGVTISESGIEASGIGITCANINGGQIGNRNLLINGDMRISQRYGTTSKALTNLKYSLDRWQVVNDAGASKFTTQQVTDAPVGFYNSLKMTSSSAYTPGTNEVFGVGQKIEGYNTSRLNFGTSNAKTITISFFVKSSLTGTFSGSVLNEDMTRGFPWTYTINSADTWERKVVNVTGAPDGTWLHDHQAGMRVFWSMGTHSTRSDTAGQWSSTQYQFGATGSTAVVATNGATLQITGCQVEEGLHATDFENRSYSMELELCQRYFTMIDADGSIDNYAPIAVGRYVNSTTAQFIIHLPTTMRQPPSIEADSTSAANTFAMNIDGGFNAQQCNNVSFNERSYNTLTVTTTSSGATGQTAGTGSTLYSDNTAQALLGISAEY